MFNDLVMCLFFNLFHHQWKIKKQFRLKKVGGKIAHKLKTLFMFITPAWFSLVYEERISGDNREYIS